VERGAAAAASFILEFKLEAGRVAVDTPDAPQPGALAAEPGAAVEVHEH